MTGGPDGGPADLVFIEVGGTVGDYENGFYIEALRELAFEEGQGRACFVALTYVLDPPTLGEQKSKAAAWHQATDGVGHPAAHHRLSSGTPRGGDRQGEGLDVLERAVAASHLDA